MSNENLATHWGRSRRMAHHDHDHLPVASPSSSLNLSRYPNSKFWLDRRSCLRDQVDVGVQCPEILPTKATGGPLPNERSIPQEANSRPPDPEVIRLSSEQTKVLELVHTGRNVFFTGPAGMFSRFEIIKHISENGKGPENQSYFEKSSRSLEHREDRWL